MGRLKKSAPRYRLASLEVLWCISVLKNTVAPMKATIIICKEKWFQAGSILLYVGQDKFHRNISHTLDYVVDQSEFTVQSLRNVSGYLDLAKTTGVDQVFLPVSDQQNIDDLNRKLNRAANDLESRTKDNSRTIRDVLENVRFTLIVVAAAMLVLAFLGLLFSILGLKTLVYFLVLGAWFLVAGTFILCGVFVLLNSSLACGHMFGMSCIRKWLQRHVNNIGKCPQCNNKVELDGIRIIYAPVIAVTAQQ